LIFGRKKSFIQAIFGEKIHNLTLYVKIPKVLTFVIKRKFNPPKAQEK
jgi:hypothetical protein